MSALYNASDGRNRGLVVLRELVIPGKAVGGASSFSGGGKPGIESASPLRVVCLDAGDMIEE